jgi:hypothetical protein
LIKSLLDLVAKGEALSNIIVAGTYQSSGCDGLPPPSGLLAVMAEVSLSLSLSLPLSLPLDSETRAYESRKTWGAKYTSDLVFVFLAGMSIHMSVIVKNNSNNVKKPRRG